MDKIISLKEGLTFKQQTCYYFIKNVNWHAIKINIA